MVWPRGKGGGTNTKTELHWPSEGRRENGDCVVKNEDDWPVKVQANNL